MELTQEQFDFFKDLDVEEAMTHGEGKVQFTFPHKGRIVEVHPYSVVAGDIIVRSGHETEDQAPANSSLSLVDIPGTANMSGPALLKWLHEAVHSRPASPAREAWLNTPHVKEWSVGMPGSHIRFSYQNEATTYELWAHKAQEIQETTTVVLLVDGQQVHTFLLPLEYPRKTSAQFVYKLAYAITVAWHDEVEGQAE